MVIHHSLKQRLQNAAPSFVCRWLCDEIIDCFMYQLYLMKPTIICCDSTTVQAIEKGRSMRKVWKNVNFKNVSMVLAPVNPTGNHWVLARLKPYEKKVILLDPMAKVIKEASSTFKTCSSSQKEYLKKSFQLSSQVFH